MALDDSDETRADSEDEGEHIDSESEWEQPQLADADKDEPPAKRFCAAIPTRRVRDKTTPITGLSAAEHRILESFNVPQAFFLVLALLGCLDGAGERDLLGVEFYSGVVCCVRCGCSCGCGKEASYGPGKCVRLGYGSPALAHEEHMNCRSAVCSAHACAMETRWLREQHFFACFCYARGLDFVVEQPASPLLWRDDALRHVAFHARKLGLTYHQISTFMPRFSAPTPKPTILTGNCSWLRALARDSPGQCDERSGTASVTVDANGRRHVTGDKPGALKETEEYTREFGQAVCDAYPAVVINSDNLDIQHEGNDMCGSMSRAHPSNNEPISKLSNNDC